jgi:hypothetical protein
MTGTEGHPSCGRCTMTVGEGHYAIYRGASCNVLVRHVNKKGALPVVRIMLGGGGTIPVVYTMATRAMRVHHVR